MIVVTSRPVAIPFPVAVNPQRGGTAVPPDAQPFNPPVVIDMGSAPFAGQAAPWYSIDDGSASAFAPDINYIFCSDAPHN
jgi:hypothetical protein